MKKEKAGGRGFTDTLRVSRQERIQAAEPSPPMTSKRRLVRPANSLKACSGLSLGSSTTYTSTSTGHCCDDNDTNSNNNNNNNNNQNNHHHNWNACQPGLGACEVLS